MYRSKMKEYAIAHPDSTPIGEIRRRHNAGEWLNVEELRELVNRAGGAKFGLELPEPGKYGFLHDIHLHRLNRQKVGNIIWEIECMWVAKSDADKTP